MKRPPRPTTFQSTTISPQRVDDFDFGSASVDGTYSGAQSILIETWAIVSIILGVLLLFYYHRRHRSVLSFYILFVSAMHHNFYVAKINSPIVKSSRTRKVYLAWIEEPTPQFENVHIGLLEKVKVSWTFGTTVPHNFYFILSSIRTKLVLYRSINIMTLFWTQCSLYICVVTYWLFCM